MGEKNRGADLDPLQGRRALLVVEEGDRLVCVQPVLNHSSFAYPNEHMFLVADTLQRGIRVIKQALAVNMS